MAYTPINWDENTPVDATKLGKMDSEIDSNEQRLTDVENGTTTVGKANNVVGSGARVRALINSTFSPPKTLEWETSEFDTDNYWDNSTKFIAPSDGIYLIELQIQFSGGQYSSGSQYDFIIDSDTNFSNSEPTSAIRKILSASDESIVVNSIIKLSQGNYVLSKIESDSSVTINLNEINCHFAITKLGI